MSKEKFTLEYTFDNSSETILWRMIGTPLGLAEWFSDGVTVTGNEYTFIWDKEEEIAYLVETKEGKFIRFQWEADKDSNYYFQLEVVSNEITGSIGLLITDFVLENEKEDTVLLWDKQVANLRLRTGM